ncbi:MAG: isoprenylcysteine carboxylmethyltransferase family protein [Dehalococcoidales bacterium]|nr:isoprenylcysteine carboxylmethyltransferase family protein [Dehalococcoidales bacterium]
MKTKKDIFWVSVLSILCIVCFPANPLVLTGVLEVKPYTVTNILAWIVWAFGMILVFAPIVMFPRRGGSPKGLKFVKTTRIVDTGIYAVIRHPQYTGGIYSIFLTTLLIYPHWLFVILGVAGTYLLYLSTRTEDKILIEKFGDEYREYIDKVPAMNFVAGTIRLLRRRKDK